LVRLQDPQLIKIEANMAEIENKKMVRVKKDGSHQIMTAFAGNTLREIVNTANEEGIKREDIVSLLRDNGQFWLVYFKQN